MQDAIQKFTGLDVASLKTIDEARDAARSVGVDEIDGCKEVGNIVSEIFDQKIQGHLVSPTFVVDYPVEVSPLAKRKRGNSSLVERFELFINGWEIANAFSELNDPEEQEQRFKMQSKSKKQNGEESHPIDLDYIRALEYGLPPTGGLGIGIDRLAMLLTNSQSIKELILFPHMKPETA